MNAETGFKEVRSVTVGWGCASHGWLDVLHQARNAKHGSQSIVRGQGINHDAYASHCTMRDTDTKVMAEACLTGFGICSLRCKCILSIGSVQGVSVTCAFSSECCARVEVGWRDDTSCQLGSANASHRSACGSIAHTLQIRVLLLLQVFMLKIDTEGFDPAVLWGSVASLRRKAVAMIMFEYNAPNIWAVTPLRTMVAWLEQLDYVCYFEGMPRIYKLGRGCWNDAYEIHTTWWVLRRV